MSGFAGNDAEFFLELLGEGFDGVFTFQCELVSLAFNGSLKSLFAYTLRISLSILK